jgi:hypothetical protein
MFSSCMVDWSGSLKTDIPFVCVLCPARHLMEAWDYYGRHRMMTIKVHLGGWASGMFHAMTIGMLVPSSAVMVVGKGREKCFGLGRRKSRVARIKFF